jgi:hypothetical protein
LFDKLDSRLDRSGNGILKLLLIKKQRFDTNFVQHKINQGRGLTYRQKRKLGRLFVLAY